MAPMLPEVVAREFSAEFRLQGGSCVRNGSVGTDDVFSARMMFMLRGQPSDQPIKPHDDLMAVFPFLWLPHH
jgi:hypothetical protein